jgi:hypothetical protein
MIEECMEVGDRVAITISKDSRDGGYNPCPDGTEATIIGFSEIDYGRVGNFGRKPGIYENRAWVRLRMPDGSEHREWAGRIELIDNAEYGRRVGEWRERRAADPTGSLHDDVRFLRDLPETPFWEGDTVRVRSRSALTTVTSAMPSVCDPDVFTIIRISYYDLPNTRNDGSPYPAYAIAPDFDAGWHTSASGADMELVERGPVWKFYHGEPIEFATVADEAAFAHRLGHDHEVRNPATGLYQWTVDEVLNAIRDGIVHGVSVVGGRFGVGPHTNAILFDDEALGKRVAAATLEGFATEREHESL